MGNLLSAQEAAERLGVSFWTVYRMARDGQLASVCIGRRRLFTAEDIDELIRATRRAEAAAEATENS